MTIRPAICAATMAAALTLASGPAQAAELFTASGSWQGEGQLATGPDAPLQRGRCRVEVTPAPGGQDVSMVGKCVVAAGASDISLRLVHGAGSTVNAGFWSAATDQVVQFSGTEQGAGKGATIRLASTTPLVVDDKSFESIVEVDAPDASSFTVRQMLRAPGAEAWRLVVDMTYHQTGG